MTVQGLGACLTQANLEDIKRFVEDFAVRALLPAMEARVRALNHQVGQPSRPPGLPHRGPCLMPHTVHGSSMPYEQPNVLLNPALQGSACSISRWSQGHFWLAEQGCPSYHVACS